MDFLLVRDRGFGLLFYNWMKVSIFNNVNNFGNDMFFILDVFKVCFEIFFNIFFCIILF